MFDDYDYEEDCMPQSVKMSIDILNLWNEVKSLRKQVKELTEYKIKYTTLLKDSRSHSDKMMYNMVEVLINSEKYKG